MVSSKDQNVLHEAILNGGKGMIKFILNDPKREHLTDEKYEDGNTPLHLLAASITYVPELIRHPRLKGTVIFNKQNLIALDIAYWGSASVSFNLLEIGKPIWRVDLTKKTKRNACNYEETIMQQIQEKKDRKERHINCLANEAKTHIVVATLIATVTFAAGITLPGGYNNSQGETQGMVILLRKSAFKAFVIIDVIGFLCSIASLIGYIQLVEQVSSRKKVKIVENLHFYAVFMMNLSLIAVVLAFATVMFTVLTHSTALAVGVSINVCLFVFDLFSVPIFLGCKEEWLIVNKLEKLLRIKKGFIEG